MSCLRSVGEVGAFEHPVFVLDVPNLDAWPSKLDLSSRHFALLIALDAKGIPDSRISDWVSLVLKAGAVSVSAWGPDCERVHDLFDHAIVSGLLTEGKESSVESVILTTWHDKEPLEDAVNFLVNVIEPAADYKATCEAWVAASIGSSAYARQIEASLRVLQGDWEP